MTIEVSTGLGGRIILAGKSQREKTIWYMVAQVIKEHILGPKQIFY